MSEANPSMNRALHRKSMLPQRTIVKPPMTINKDDLDSNNAAATSLKPLDTEKARTKAILPPSTLAASLSMQESLSTRQSSQRITKSSRRISRLAKTSYQDDLQTSAKPGATQKLEEVPAVTQSSKHRQSTSQQIGYTPMSNISKLPSRAQSLRQSSLQGSKPAFSVMQQHYSPQKRSIPSAPNQSLISAQATDLDIGESVDLQVELSQLHIMHRSAATVQRQWEQSAKNSSWNRFNDLCARHVELKEISHQQRTLLNQLALVEWCQGTPSAQLAEKVQQVSQNIADVRTFLEPEGKYSRVLGIFQSWFARAHQIESRRDTHNVVINGQDVTFIEGIGDGWKAEAMVLERELTYFLRELKAFGELRAVSSLGRILSLHRTLISNLLEELDIIQWIENETMLHEGALVEQTINKLSSNISKKI